MDNYEKLGAFYLGRLYDLKRKRQEEGLLLYDSKDLVTHAFCVGMTGSGKTGLCISLLEEAAIDGIPALIVDPKGDLANLLLTFPELRPKDFEPWVNEDDARRQEKSVAEFAADQAALWRNGLDSWGQGGERIRRLRDSAEFVVYTPGSSAGVPVSILSSFAAPPEALRSDGDLLMERTATTASSLLGLLGIKADPIRSREHILLSTLFGHYWRQGQDLDLGQLIQSIQTPPVTRVGVLDMESFYPSRDRFELAMQINNLLASPSFQSWMTGEPLDVGRMLHNASGKPRMSILSIAHLSETERMFFVSLLLNQTLGWMRTRPGTTSLRALLYMDEIFGYMPPTAEPPSKKPLLTLLKQARAYGLGVVLATQNPVDLDYKGLSNIGTWFLGRLQTERDKIRVLEGLEGAAAGGGFDRGAMEEILAGLGKRVFLMHNVHEDQPVIFHTRWAMSYLRGPLTRQQIKLLMRDRPAATEATTVAGAVAAKTAAPPAGTRPVSERPVLPPEVPQVFIPLREASEQPIYQPGLLGVGRIQFVDRKTKKVRHTEQVALLQTLAENSIGPDWEAAEPVEIDAGDLQKQPTSGASFGSVPGIAGNPRNFTKWKKQFSDTLYRTRSCEIFSSPTLEMVSDPGESERDFRIRLAELGRESRDEQAEKLRKKYATKVNRLEERIRRALQAVEREEAQASGQKLQTAISFGTTLLSAFMGRKRMSIGTLGRATTAARGVGRASKEKKDVERARDNVAALDADLEALNAELEQELDALEERLDPMREELETLALRPRRADIDVRVVSLAWSPHESGPGGSLTRLW